MKSACFLALAIYILNCEPVRSQEPYAASESLGRLDVYPGLEATLFASEPMIASPTNIDIDRRGRVWVCDVNNYRAHAETPVRHEGDRILILEDTDGDGVADERKIYYQGRDVDAALGICVLGNQVIVSCAPNIIVFTDNDGDDKPDKKDFLFTKTGRPQDDHSTHSVVLGPDDKFYWNFGNNGGAVHDNHGNLVHDTRGRPVIDRRIIGSKPEWKDLESPFWGGMAFRCNRDGTEFEVLGHNFRNNYELAVDSFGTVWQTDNDDDGNFGCRINYVMESGNFGYRDEMTGASWKERRVNAHEAVSMRHWHQNDPGVVPNFIQTGAGSPTGITVYEGRLLPEVFWDQPLACDAGPGVVWCAKATPDGAGFEGELINLVKSDRDKWFRPVDVAVAPDGSVFVSDWHDPHVGWNRQGDLPHGRIFRIAPKGHRYTIPSEPSFDTPNRDARLQAEAFMSSEDYHRIFDESKNARTRARALWKIGLAEPTDREFLFKALRDEDPDIRMVTVRIISHVNEHVTAVGMAAKDPSPRVRREVALALRRYSSGDAMSIWVTLATQHNSKDRWYLEALGIGAAEFWDLALPFWITEQAIEDRYHAGEILTLEEEQILWRSRAAQTANFLMVMCETMDWRWRIRALDFLPDRDKQSDLARLAFGEEIEMGQRLEAILRLPLESLSDQEFLKKAYVTPETVSRVLKESTAWTGDSIEAKLAVINHLGATDTYPAILQWAKNHPDHPKAAEALALTLAEAKPEVLQGFVQGDDLARNITFIQLLGQHQSKDVCDVLTHLLLAEEAPTALREACVLALGKGTRGIESMIALAEDGKFPESLIPTAGIAIKSTYNVGLHDRAVKWFPPPSTQGHSEIPQMTDLIVYVGDAEKGKEVFAKTTCSTCHVVNGQGTSYGPNLSSIGSKLSKQALYEAILNPSAGVSPSYRLYEVTLQSGDVLVGFIESEDTNALTLRLPGGALSKQDKLAIKETRAILKSAMPATLIALMSVDELVDLVAYLEQLKDPNQR